MSAALLADQVWLRQSAFSQSEIIVVFTRALPRLPRCLPASDLQRGFNSTSRSFVEISERAAIRCCFRGMNTHFLLEPDDVIVSPILNAGNYVRSVVSSYSTTTVDGRRPPERS